MAFLEVESLRIGRRTKRLMIDHAVVREVKHLLTGGGCQCFTGADHSNPPRRHWTRERLGLSPAPIRRTRTTSGYEHLRQELAGVQYMIKPSQKVRKEKDVKGKQETGNGKTAFCIAWC
jgi:hypothetical protein